MHMVQCERFQEEIVNKTIGSHTGCLDCRDEKGFEMKIRLVLCWLAVVIMVAGCATNKSTAKVSVAGTPYVVRQITLPKQKAGAMPFSIRVETSYLPRSEKELVPAMVACEYLEVIGARDQLPLQVREGLIVKRGNQWQLAELPFEKGRRHGCLPPFIHYAVWGERK